MEMSSSLILAEAALTSLALSSVYPSAAVTLPPSRVTAPGSAGSREEPAVAV